MTVPRGSVTLSVWIVVVVVAVGVGVYFIGSPSNERARRLDNRRLMDLQSIAEAVDLYWTRHDRLPPSVDELTEEAGVTLSTADPVTAEEYRYTVLDTLQYQLCGDFERESSEVWATPNSIWAHGVGNHCFVLEAKEVTNRSVPSF